MDRGVVGALFLLWGLSGNSFAAVDCRIKPGIGAEAARRGVCGFDLGNRSFSGSAVEQAGCLTTFVRQGGVLGPRHLPDYLRGIVGQAVGITAPQLALYLRRQGIPETDIGGKPDESLSAAYFIIHDTSTPNCSEPGARCNGASGPKGAFPAAMDDVGWSGNSGFNGYKSRTGRPIANLMVNRVGGSLGMADLDEVVHTTKFEICSDVSAKSGLFVGIENVQPRIGSPANPLPGRKANDLVAPVPGFTKAQYDRLGLVYVVAGIRHGKWLVPAFHAVLDQDFLDGHDDPQHFDIEAFSASVKSAADAIRVASDAAPVARSGQTALKFAPLGAGLTCSRRWGQEGRGQSQAAAKAFGRRCLISDGARDVRLSKPELDVLLRAAIPDTGGLTGLQPGDVDAFCKGYPAASPGERAEFWRTLFAALVDQESGNDAVAPFWEAPQAEYSIGLTQVSFSNNRAYSCGFDKETDLTDPGRNLACGVKVMVKLVGQSGLIGDRGGSPATAAAYWSTLRTPHHIQGGAEAGPPRDARAYIQARTRALPFCR